MPSVVTANRLREGDVVYLAAGGTWVEELARAAVATSKAELAALEAEAARATAACEVTAVYAMDVMVADGRPGPASVRERIRAARGPSAQETAALAAHFV